MSTARATLAAEHRDITGKKVARLRRAGRLPAVVYGHGVDSDSVSVDAHEFEQLRRHSRPERAGRPVGRRREGRSRSSSTASRSTRSTGGPLHVDLFLVRMTEELTVDVPLVADRRVAGRRRSRAARSSTRSSPSASGRCRITCRSRSSTRSSRWSTSTPPSTSATWSIPADVTLLTDGDEIIAKVQAPRVEEEPVVVGAAEAAEGEAAEGAEAAEGGRRRGRRPRSRTRAEPSGAG